MANLTPTLSQAFSRAISAYNAGALVEAEQLCQQIIIAKRDLFDGLHLSCSRPNTAKRFEEALPVSTPKRLVMAQEHNPSAERMHQQAEDVLRRKVYRNFP
jgi:hypothetical protein